VGFVMGSQVLPPCYMGDVHRKKFGDEESEGRIFYT
jgi:hypothetical protein